MYAAILLCKLSVVLAAATPAVAGIDDAVLLLPQELINTDDMIIAPKAL
jgi:hypothetical protein